MAMDTLVCPRCGTINEQGTRFCYQCGSLIVKNNEDKIPSSAEKNIEIILTNTRNMEKKTFILQLMLTVGRSPENSFVIQNEKVSSRHCIFWVKNGKVWIRDNKSTNGTRLNGVLLQQEAEVKNGDILDIANQRFIVHIKIREMEKEKSSGECFKSESILEEGVKFCGNDGTQGENEYDENGRMNNQKVNTNDNGVVKKKMNIEQRSCNGLCNRLLSIIELIVITALLYRYHCSIFLIVGSWIAEIADIIFEKKNLKTVHKVVTSIGVVIALLSCIQIYNGYQNEKYISVVQEQQYRNISYKELFENFSDDLVWECTEKRRFTVVDPNEPGRGGSFEAVVTVSGGCYVYNEETTYNLKFNVSKETNKAVPVELQYYGMNYSSSDEINRFLDSVYRNYMQYVGGISNNIASTERGINNQSTVISENSETNHVQNSTDIVNENNSVSENDKFWFKEYDSFYHVRAGDELSVNDMNDTLLFVSFFGINGESMEWELNLEPDEIGVDGEFIYYYGKDFRLSYYPSDHHIYIETSDDLYSGEYWVNE